MQARALKNYEIDTYSYAGVYLLIHDQMPGSLGRSISHHSQQPRA